MERGFENIDGIYVINGLVVEGCIGIALFEGGEGGRRRKALCDERRCSFSTTEANPLRRQPRCVEGPHSEPGWSTEWPAAESAG